jgi:spermidine synthase
VEMWFTDRETDHLRVEHGIKRILYQGRSKYQEIAVIEGMDFGRMLILDGVIQLSQRDEFVYHEMLTHVPLLTHPKPEKVLVIGGGDGGTVREVLKHPEVRRVHLVDIDAMVLDVCREYFPELAGSLDDPRVTVHIADGIEFVKTRRQAFDVILIDSTDPEGPGEGLFTEDFYGNVAGALRKEGSMAMQSGSSVFTPELVQQTYEKVSSQFTAVWVYTASVPTYSVAPFSLMLAAKRHLDPTLPRRQPKGPGMRYYSPEIHKASFALPPYVRELLGQNVNDRQPSIA